MDLAIDYYTIKRRIGVFFFLLIPMMKMLSQEQKHLISIIDRETRTPIENVHVYLDNSLFLLSDKNGFFYINDSLFIADNHSLSFSCVGYQKAEISFAKLKEESFIVKLDKENIQIEESIIYGNYNQQKSHISYKKLSSLPRRIHSFSSAIYKDTIYVTGGIITNAWNDDFILSDMYKYSIKSDKWVKSNHTFNKRARHAMHIYNGRIYIIGGMTENNRQLYLENTIEIFNINTQEILTDKTNPHKAINFSSVLKDSLLISMGGTQRILNNNEKVYLKDIHLFNIKTGYWYKLGELNEGKETKGVLIEDKIYLIGGHSFHDLDIIESYNLKTGETTIETKLLQAAARPAVTTNEHIIYIFNKGLVYTYDTINKEIKTYLIDINLDEAELHYYDNKLYILGGKESFIMKNDEKYEAPVFEGSPYVFCIDIEEFNTTKSIN